MPGNGSFDAIPLWGFFLATLLLVLLSIEIGFRLGIYRRKRTEEEKEGPVGSMAGAALGLLAFMLAFTFGAAAERFDTRRQLLLDEANAIGTTYLRAGMLPERRAEIRTLLRNYVDIRLEAAQNGKLAEGIRQSEQLQNQLWAHTVALGENHPSSIVVGLFVQSLNEVIDLHAKRVTVVLWKRIPGAIWLALCVVAALSFATMGYHAALSRTTRSPAAIAVVITFSVVIWLVADLDRPQDGFLKVSQRPLTELRQSMQESAP